MSYPKTITLGALAGLTIYLGLPIGRLRLLGTRSRVALAMFAVGVLAFIFVDVLSGAHEIMSHALDALKAHEISVTHVIALVTLLAVAFAAGSAGLATLERRFRPTRTPAPIAGGSQAAFTPAELSQLASQADAAHAATLRTGLTIAAAIGVHNFAEGLAIGVSARTGAISLATVLIIGFALHNATEGFGIIGPLGHLTPSWRWIGLAGLIAGGPTLLGTIVGHTITSTPLELTTYALAGGAILYVIGEVWTAMRRHGHRELGLLMMTAGFLTGVITDLIVTYAGA